jgi:hypothetical protein
MPTLAEFQNGIFISGGYAGPPANAPVLRNAAGVSTGVLLAHDDVPLPAGTVLSASVTAAGGPPALANTPAVAPGAPVAEGASGGQTVPFGPPAAVAAGAGNAVLLPFVPDMISYVVIPANPASGVDYFYTAPLSGCSVFIDRTAAGDLVVYHANRLALTVTPNPAAYLAATPLAEQYQPARNQMRADHNTLMGALSGPLGGPLTPLASLERAAYYQCVENERARKIAQGRTNVTNMAGTNAMGFRIGGAWQFWWQTWAILSYDRPATAPKTLTSGRHQGIVPGTGRLLGTGQFH